MRPWQQYLTGNSDRLSHFGRRMSLFLQTLVLRGILFREQEHRKERLGEAINLLAVRQYVRTGGSRVEIYHNRKRENDEND
jgi:hypothetical protein